MANVGEITRREFLKVTGCLAGGIAFGSAPFLAGCGFPAAPEIDAEAYSLTENTVMVMLDKIPRLSRVGGSAAIINENYKISLIIARIAEDSFVAALNECPHREKPLGYDHEARTFICASGKSEFRLDGSIVSGPAENSLPIYHSYLDQNKLIIDLSNKQFKENKV